MKAGFLNVPSIPLFERVPLILLALALSGVTRAEPSGGGQADDLQRRLQIVTQIQQLQAELRDLRGALEENSHDVSNLKRRQREFYLDLDRRLIELESRPASSEEAPAASSGGTVTQPPAEQAGDGSPAELKMLEQQAYRQAFDLLKAAKYDEAITAYQQFLQLYPNGDYADNARYWVGEAHYVTRNFDKALVEFNRLLELHPASSKRADAELKIGYIFYEQGKWADARQLLSRVASNASASAAARLAKSRLDRMTEEGH
ncbi:MAG: tol-pal system protein YbgF [Immundisolibacteraceae bacterium]|nr:tol-pal system protein YbgF [Immundisolibacteraceae bacterium]